MTAYVTQSSSFTLAFPSFALEMGKTPTSGVRGGQRGENHVSQTKIWSKIITKDRNQDDGRLWVSFICFGFCCCFVVGFV